MNGQHNLYIEEGDYYEVDSEENYVLQLDKFIVSEGLLDNIPEQYRLIFQLEAFKVRESRVTETKIDNRPNGLNKWDYRFLELANLVSSWSKDPTSKVGAVLVKDKHIISTGFNGFPSCCNDSLEIYNDRETKLNRVVHAEANAIVQCARFGSSTLGCTLYSTLHPCNECAKLIISAGMVKVVTYKPEPSSKWTSHFTVAKELFLESGVELIEI